jgi:pyruvate formate lyase activating enzyme
MTITESGAQSHRARWWHGAGDAIQCSLCPRGCRIQNGHTGFCNGRANVSGQLISLTYGRVCATAVDPIEKKPIFHYRPGARLYSVGTFGCNLDCDFCQNAVMARARYDDIPSVYITPDELVATAGEKKADGIGWTFNDPVVWSEYIIDVSALARARGMFNLLNTNGYIEPRARDELLAHIDVVKVDIKGFGERTYEELSGARLAPVLETCMAVVERGIHLELAYPVIPGMTDDPTMLVRFGNWVLEELGPDVPVHLFRFQPAHRLSHVESPELSRMNEIKERLTGQGVRFVYLGGVTGEDQDTRCPRCGSVVISRRAEEPGERIFIKREQVSRFCPTFASVRSTIVDGCCPKCGESLPIRQSIMSGHG